MDEIEDNLHYKHVETFYSVITRQTQVMTLNSPMSLGHRSCTVKTDILQLISDLISVW